MTLVFFLAYRALTLFFVSYSFSYFFASSLENDMSIVDMIEEALGKEMALVGVEKAGKVSDNE